MARGFVLKTIFPPPEALPLPDPLALPEALPLALPLVLPLADALPELEPEALPEPFAEPFDEPFTDEEVVTRNDELEEPLLFVLADVDALDSLLPLDLASASPLPLAPPLADDRIEQPTRLTMTAEARSV